MTSRQVVPPTWRHPMALFLRTAAPLYATLLARRHLDGVWARGLDDLRAQLAKGPVILAPNHVGWFDGQLVLVLHRVLGVEGRFLVKADNVEKMSYLRLLGGIPIDPTSTSGSLAAMEEAAAWLDGPGKLLWIFPQGRFRPPSVRPLELQRGVELLHRISNAVIVPVGSMSAWRDLHLPAWGLSFGAPVSGRDRLLPRLEEALIAEIETLERWFDQPASVEGVEAIVPSVVWPYEKGLGSRFYLLCADIFRAIAKAVRRVTG